MPIRVLDELPAVNFLHDENVFVITQSQVDTQISLKKNQSIKVLILNLMPRKIEAENQFLRLLSHSPLQVDVYLLRIDHRESKHTAMEHVQNFYHDFIDICHENFDGLIVTGAPLGLVDFSDIIFWPDMEKIVLWAIEHVKSILFICWSVQAALKIFYDLPRFVRKKKLVGVYTHTTLNDYSLLTRGFDTTFIAPHSRYIDFSAKIIRQFTDLEVLVESDEAGAYLFTSKDKRLVFVTGHPEYDVCTLAREYYRDLQVGLQPVIPVNYFPNNDPYCQPVISWRSHGYLLFSNWLNYYVYQVVPYDIRRVSNVV